MFQRVTFSQLLAGIGYLFCGISHLLVSNTLQVHGTGQNLADISLFSQYPFFNHANSRAASLGLPFQSIDCAAGFPVLHLENKHYLAPDLLCGLYPPEVPQVVISVCKSTLKKLIS